MYKFDYLCPQNKVFLGLFHKKVTSQSSAKTFAQFLGSVLAFLRSWAVGGAVSIISLDMLPLTFGRNCQCQKTIRTKKLWKLEATKTKKTFLLLFKQILKPFWFEAKYVVIIVMTDHNSNFYQPSIPVLHQGG